MFPYFIHSHPWSFFLFWALSIEPRKTTKIMLYYIMKKFASTRQAVWSHHISASVTWWEIGRGDKTNNYIFVVVRINFKEQSLGNHITSVYVQCLPNINATCSAKRPWIQFQSVECQDEKHADVLDKMLSQDLHRSALVGPSRLKVTCRASAPPQLYRQLKSHL